MRPALIVVALPGLCEPLHLGQRGKLVHIQELVAQRPVERFDMRIVRRRAGAGEVHPDLVMIGLEIDDLTGKFRAIVAKHRVGLSTQIN